MGMDAYDAYSAQQQPAVQNAMDMMSTSFFNPGGIFGGGGASLDPRDIPGIPGGGESWADSKLNPLNFFKGLAEIIPTIINSLMNSWFYGACLATGLGLMVWGGYIQMGVVSPDMARTVDTVKSAVVMAATRGVGAKGGVPK